MSEYFTVRDTKLQGVQLISPRVNHDDRGYVYESFRDGELPLMGSKYFCQHNVAVSKRNAIRGLHIQKHGEQAKLVQCVHGAIFDVVVDLRWDSPSFREWQSFMLGETNNQMLFIPAGCAHGFCTLSDKSVVTYLMTAYYGARKQLSLAWDDPTLNINWPIESEPILSNRDKHSWKLDDVIEELKR